MRASTAHRIGARLVLFLVLGSTFLAVLAPMARAAHELGNFELDGNPQAGVAAGDDWQDILGSNPMANLGGAIAKTSIPIGDSDSPTDVTYYTGGGSKDVRDVSQWQHSSNDVAPDKDEILNAFAAAYRPGGPSGDLIVYFGSDRFAQSGSAEMGFWFFKNKISLNSDGTFSGVHSNGDLLLLSDFTTGGKVQTVDAYEWQNGNLVKKGGTAPDCADAAGAHDFCATVNRAPGNGAAVWPYLPKSGGSGVYLPGAFLEGGINVSDLTGQQNVCFSSFLAETRSSHSTSAQLKDFVLGDFDVCRPSTTLGGSGSVTQHAGEAATLTWTETNDGDTPLTSPSVSANNGCSPAYASGDANSDGKLDIGETWTFTCSVSPTSTTTYTAIGTGTDPRTGRTVTWCAAGTTPANTVCDAQERAQVTVTVINPSTSLSGAGAVTQYANQSAVLTWSETNDGDSALTNPTVTANNGCSPAYDSGDANTNGVLDVGETWVFKCTVTPGATTTYTAIGSGTDATGDAVTWCAAGATPANTVCDPDERAQVQVKVINPSTSLSGAGAVTQHANESATITWTETNDGDAPLTSPTVSANNGCSPAYDSGDTNSNGVLDPGESWVFECTVTPTSTTTYTALGSGVDEIGNTVTWCAAGTTPAGTLCDAQERAQVVVTVVNPSTSLSGAGAVTQHAGESAVLTWTETNDGDDALSNPTVSANNGCSPAYDSGDANSNNKLDVGESWIFKCTVTPTSTTTYTAIGSGVDSTGDTVTWCAAGTSPANTVCDADERAQVTVTVINPSTSLGGSASAMTVGVGSPVTLTWTETNDGDSALTNPTVTVDNGCNAVASGGDTNSNGILDIGEAWTFTCTVNPTSTTTYTAIGSGTDTTGDAVTWCAAGATPANTVCDPDERAQITITVVGAEGCTPGYWKNHPQAWPNTAYSPTQKVNTVFTVNGNLGNKTLMEALNFEGGDTVQGARQILLRAAVAALLNASHPGVDYTMTEQQIINAVNAASATGDRATILALATQLDTDNNLGCPLNNLG